MLSALFEGLRASDVERVKEAILPLRPQTLRFLAISVAAVAVLQLAAGWLHPTMRLWGLNQLLYFSIPFRISFVAVILLFTSVSLFPFSSASSSRFEKIFSANNSFLPALFAGAISLPIFWYLRSSTQLLGDGQVLVNDAAIVKPTTSILEIVTLALQTRTPLSTVIYFLTAQYGQAWFGLSRVVLFQGLSCVAGAVYVYSVFWFTGRIFKNRPSRIIAISLLLFQGGIGLYFGYIEYYTLFHLAVFLYCASAILSLRSEQSLVAPTFILLCAIGFHFLGVLLIPSYLYLLAQRRGKNFLQQWLDAKGMLIALGGLVVLFVIVYVLTGEYQLRKNFVPLQSLDVTLSYTLFSRSHLVDIINLLFLISPVAIIIVLGTIRFRSNFDWNDPAVLFLFLAAICSMGFSFVANTDIGFARDWDVMLCMSSSMILLVAFIASKILETDSKISFFIAVSSILLALPWVLLNSNRDASVRRFEHLLSMDRTVIGDYRTAYGYEMLSIHFRQEGQPDLEREYLGKAIEASDNMRFHENLVVSFNRSGVSLQDTLLLTKVIERLHADITDKSKDKTLLFYKDHLNLYFVSLRFMRELGFCHRTERYYKEAIAADVPDIGYAYLGLGQCLAEKGDYLSALSYYDRVKLGTLQIVPRDLQLMAQTYYASAQYRRAKEVFELLLKQAPEDEEAVFGLGMSLFKLKDYPNAQIVFKKYLEDFPHGRRFGEILSLLRKE